MFIFFAFLTLLQVLVAAPLPLLVTRYHTAPAVTATETFITGTTTIWLPPVEIFISNGVTYTFTDYQGQWATTQATTTSTFSAATTAASPAGQTETTETTPATVPTTFTTQSPTTTQIVDSTPSPVTPQSPVTSVQNDQTTQATTTQAATTQAVTTQAATTQNDQTTQPIVASTISTLSSSTSTSSSSSVSVSVSSPATVSIPSTTQPVLPTTDATNQPVVGTTGTNNAGPNETTSTTLTQASTSSTSSAQNNDQTPAQTTNQTPAQTNAAPTTQTTTQTPAQATTQATQVNGGTTSTSTTSTSTSTSSTTPVTTAAPITTTATSTTSTSTTATSTSTSIASGFIGAPSVIVYSPYASDNSCKSYGAIEADLKLIKSKGINKIRLYGADCLVISAVLPLCVELGITVNQGFWISSAGVDSIDGAVSEVVSWAQTNNGWGVFDFFTVGNEAINDGFCTVPQLIAKISSVKAILNNAGWNGKITTSEPPITFINHPDLCTNSAIDFVGVNPHSYFNTNLYAYQAGEYVTSQQAQVAGICSKSAFITETGYPHKGNAYGNNVPSDENQYLALQSIMKYTGGDVTILTAFDDMWKHPGPHDIEQYFGMLNLVQ